MIKWDWSVSVWQVVTVAWLGLTFFFAVVRKLDKILSLLSEYPLHRHIDGAAEPIYPRGMKPNGGD